MASEKRVHGQPLIDLLRIQEKGVRDVLEAARKGKPSNVPSREKLVGPCTSRTRSR